MLNVLIPKETDKGETRVSATPETVKKMIKEGLVISVESKAGDKAYFSDDKYKDAGARVATDVTKLFEKADIILKVNPPTKEEIALTKEKATWISMMVPQTETSTIKQAAGKKITLFSMNLIPRISRAQKMDALTSQSNIAGYKSVLMAANELGSLFPLLMTAAGTIQPAKVVILGVGVAGLQAIATARRLGAQVEASDIRPIVKEQVESLGAKFIEVEPDEDAEDEGGYAKAASKEYLKRQAEEVKKRIKQADVVITTALIPGRKAPVLVTEEMVKSMKQGSVIVDMAVGQGGNCELSQEGKIIVKHGVRIIGEGNIPATVPVHSSEMYAKNILNFILAMTKQGKLNLDMEDEVIAKSLVTKDGKIVFEQPGGKK